MTRSSEAAGTVQTKPGRWLNRTVGGAGLTSALGDFCYETTTVTLPGFLAVLGIPAAVLGLIEGIADAVSSFTKLVAGYIADKFGHRKALVLASYALTPVGQALIALAAGWPLILVGRLVSWFGKDLRGRCAMRSWCRPLQLKRGDGPSAFWRTDTGRYRCS